MNPIAEEIESYLGSASMTDEEYLAHYGMEKSVDREGERKIPGVPYGSQN